MEGKYSHLKTNRKRKNKKKANMEKGKLHDYPQELLLPQGGPGSSCLLVVIRLERGGWSPSLLMRSLDPVS